MNCPIAVPPKNGAAQCNTKKDGVNAMSFIQKYPPPHCFFCNFAGWDIIFL